MVKTNQLLNLTNKTAIVTGGSLGIGKAIVYRLAEAGGKVLFTGRNKEEIKKSEDEFKKLNFQVVGLKSDVSVEEDIKKMIDETVSRFGGLDILVNNAGVYPSQLVSQMSEEDFKKVIDINLKGVFLASKYGSEMMIKQGKGGKIINISSIAAIHAISPGLAHYVASKHAVWGFTKTLALELAPYNIQVNAIAPGAIATPGVQKMNSGTSQADVDMVKVLEEFMKKIPMRRMGEADEIAKVVLFLASEMSSYMTGSQIVVDGGRLLT